MVRKCAKCGSTKNVKTYRGYVDKYCLPKMMRPPRKSRFIKGSLPVPVSLTYLSKSTVDCIKLCQDCKENHWDRGEIISWTTKKGKPMAHIKSKKLSKSLGVDLEAEIEEEIPLAFQSPANQQAFQFNTQGQAYQAPSYQLPVSPTPTYQIPVNPIPLQVDTQNEELNSLLRVKERYLKLLNEAKATDLMFADEDTKYEVEKRISMYTLKVAEVEKKMRDLSS